MNIAHFARRAGGGTSARDQFGLRLRESRSEARSRELPRPSYVYGHQWGSIHTGLMVGPGSTFGRTGDFGASGLPRWRRDNAITAIQLAHETSVDVDGWTVAGTATTEVFPPSGCAVSKQSVPEESPHLKRGLLIRDCPLMASKKIAGHLLALLAFTLGEHDEIASALVVVLEPVAVFLVVQYALDERCLAGHRRVLPFSPSRGVIELILRKN